MLRNWKIFNRWFLRQFFLCIGDLCKNVYFSLEGIAILYSVSISKSNVKLNIIYYKLIGSKINGLIKGLTTQYRSIILKIATAFTSWH